MIGDIVLAQDVTRLRFLPESGECLRSAPQQVAIINTPSLGKLYQPRTSSAPLRFKPLQLIEQ
jgi:hypothetical protein